MEEVTNSVLRIIVVLIFILLIVGLLMVAYRGAEASVASNASLKSLAQIWG